MKKSELKQIIKEEIKSALKEYTHYGKEHTGWGPTGGYREWDETDYDDDEIIMYAFDHGQEFDTLEDLEWAFAKGCLDDVIEKYIKDDFFKNTKYKKIVDEKPEDWNEVLRDIAQNKNDISKFKWGDVESIKHLVGTKTPCQDFMNEILFEKYFFPHNIGDQIEKDIINLGIDELNAKNVSDSFIDDWGERYAESQED